MSSESLNPNQPVFTAADLIAHQRARGLLPDIASPESVILTFQRELMDYAVHKYRTKRFKLFGGELYLFKGTDNRIGLIGGFGAGSPAMAAVVDQLAAFGVRRFVAIGLAGSLQPDLNTGSLVISTSAIRGEGVSQHYLSPYPTVDSSEEMVRGLSEILTKHNQHHILGTTWTTDAPFRELRKIVLEHQRAGVLAVDMEAAALLSVARSMNLSAVAAFSIADQLADGHWKMSNDLRPAQKGLTILFDAVFEYLTL